MNRFYLDIKTGPYPKMALKKSEAVPESNDFIALYVMPGGSHWITSDEYVRGVGQEN